jgi:hypothetical protein
MNVPRLATAMTGPLLSLEKQILDGGRETLRLAANN